MIQSIKRTFNFIYTHPLAKKHLVKAIVKFVQWQIKCVFSKRFHKVKFINDTYFLAKKGSTGITGNIYCGLHEFEDMGFLLHLLRPHDTFFDVGANVGSYTLLASGVCKAKAVSFEPALNTFQYLQKNIELNNLDYLVHLQNKGVGNDFSTLNFTQGGDTTNHIILNNNDANATTIELVPLDSFYPEYQPSLIKIDVEGFETEVLNGASKILANKKLKAIIIELNGSGERYGYKDSAIHNMLTKNEFKPYTYNPLNRLLQPLPTYGSFNTIYIRDLALVEERIKQANPFSVFSEKI